MFNLPKYLFLLFLVISVFSCNLVITFVNEYDEIPETGPKESVFPTPEPTIVPSDASSPYPTMEPTFVPTGEPTLEPTIEPAIVPTAEPTPEPTTEATIVPTTEPTGDPGATSEPYEILFDTGSASGWFGGDDSNPRNVGYGQGVYIDNYVVITDFSFYFTSSFDYPYNPEFTGHEVVLRLHIRDASGVVMGEYDCVVPASFSGGWVTWSDLDWSAVMGETLIFTAFLVDGYNTMLSSGAAGDMDAGYLNGSRYSNTGYTDTEMTEWAGWGVHPWDSWFWLRGYVQ
jgi:hypothetical protein